MSSNKEKKFIPLTESELFVRTSDENVEILDPQRITDALASETSLSSETTHQIAIDVKEQSRLSGIRALTAPLIRGLVDAKLLERGLMNEYRLHSRLGVPIYDVDRVIQSVSGGTAALHGPEGSSLALADAIKREYAFRTAFPDAVPTANRVGNLPTEHLGKVAGRTTLTACEASIKRNDTR